MKKRQTASGAERRDAFVNGVLAIFGLYQIVDQAVIHWALGLHRVLPGHATATTFVETAGLAIGVITLVVGFSRELLTQRRAPGPGRWDAFANGGLVVLGASLLFDNVVLHWLLRLHRFVAGPNAVLYEATLAAFGAALLGVGLHRQWRGFRRQGSTDD